MTAPLDIWLVRTCLLDLIAVIESDLGNPSVAGPEVRQARELLRRLPRPDLAQPALGAARGVCAVQVCQRRPGGVTGGRLYCWPHAKLYAGWAE